MKVLFDHPDPFALTHGGFQIQIEQTRLALLDNEVEVDFLQWWNPHQKGEIIHYFGRPRAAYIEMAHNKNCKVVLAELLTGAGSRSASQLAMQRLCISVLRKSLPPLFAARLAWNSYRLADACVALTAWEAHVMSYLFDAPPGRVHVLPNAVENAFLTSTPLPRGQWLVCSATITERKRVLELAEAAARARTPLWIIGKPYGESDPYAQRFITLARHNPEIIRYEGSINDRTQLAQAYSAARGFVLLSSMETRSLAAEEAAACGCPLLLSDLPWAHSVFGETAMYCPLTNTATTARHLREFYDKAPARPKPARPKSWTEVGCQLKGIYQSLLNPVGR